MRCFKAFAKDVAGATAMEYAIIGVLISIAIVAGATLAGANVGGMFNNVGNAF